MSITHLLLGRRRLFRPVVVAIGVFATTLWGASFAQATTYDFAFDFSITNNNPNGVWGYGYETTLGNTFLPFDNPNTQVHGGNTLQFWESTAVNVQLVPAIFKNLGPGTQFGLPAGQVALHGGPNNEFTVLRFTAPVTSVYTISSQFFTGDFGDTNALVVLNNVTALPLFAAPTTNTDPVFNTLLALTTGQTVDFIVGTNGNFSGDTTPVSVTIMSVVPEASSVTLIGASLLPLTGLVLMRRRKK